MKIYEIANDAGAEWADRLGNFTVAHAIGDELELELDAREERALLAAGWLSEPETKKKGD